MPHICADEIFALMYAMPFIGLGVYWLKTKFKALIKKDDDK